MSDELNIYMRLGDDKNRRILRLRLIIRRGKYETHKTNEDDEDELI